MPKKVDHQFGLFKGKDALPKTKIRMGISKERIKAANESLKGDGRTALEVLQEMNDKLEAYEQRLTNKKPNGKKKNSY
jgi:hypothetical protein